MTAGERVALAAYGWILRLLTPVYLLKLFWRGRAEPAYAQRIGERFGFYPGPPDAAGDRLWIHAVSLGETRAAEPLIAALRAARPGLRLLLTHGTATGLETGRALLRPGDGQTWQPVDTPGAARRFFAHERPRLGVLMETEVWPNLLLAARRAGVPMAQANARLSERSFRRGRRVMAVLGPAIRSVALVLAQGEADAARIRAAGARRVEVAGNLKYDLTPDPALIERGRGWRQRLGRPVVLAASTREGEEALLLAAWRRAEVGDALLLIVPRHPQRFDEVAAAVRSAGLTLARRSDWPTRTAGRPDPALHPLAVDAGIGGAPAAGRPIAAATVADAPSEPATPPPDDALAAEAWLGDSLREMPLYYGLADVALLGGSFGPFGGQNLIEAAACGCPLVIGPSTFNFAEAAAGSLAAGASERVADPAEAVARALEWLRDAPARAERAARARAFAQADRGAAERMARRLLALYDGDLGGGGAGDRDRGGVEGRDAVRRADST